jgi:uncharacterized protein (DUF1330 family)
MTDKALLFVTATPVPDGQVAMQEYLQNVMPLLLASGGTLLRRGAIQTVVEGSPEYKMVMVMEFENSEIAQAVFTSDAYQALKPVRDRGFSRIDISIAQPQ